MQRANGYFEYVAAGGEAFDALALRFYTQEGMAHYIIEANPALSDVLLFRGGERLRIPILENIESPASLPPWRRERGQGL